MPRPTLQDCLSRLALWVYCLNALIGIAFLSPIVHAQHERDVVSEILKPEIMPQSVALFQLRQYLLARVAAPPAATSAQQWTSEAAKIREKLLSVVYHGWPKEWVTGPLKVEDLGI